MKKLIILLALLAFACSKIEVEPVLPQVVPDGASGCWYKYYEESENLYWWDNTIYSVCPICGDPVVIVKTVCDGIIIYK